MPTFEALEGRQFMSASVSGVVYNDLNVNASLQASDPKIGGVRVYADLGNHGSYVAGDPSAITNSNGAYTLNNLPDGHLTLRQVVPAGYRQTEPTAGAHVVDIVNSSTHLTNVNFGDTHKVRYSGYVFNDSNGDGLWTKGEPVVVGATVFLDPYGTGQFEPNDPHATTNASGYWVIGDMAPGYNYTAHVIPPAGDIQTAPANNGGYETQLQAGQTADNLNFGVRPATVVFNSIQRTAYTLAGEPTVYDEKNSNYAGLFNTTSQITDPITGDTGTANLESNASANTIFAAGSFSCTGQTSEADDTIDVRFTLSKATNYSYGYDVFGNNFLLQLYKVNGPMIANESQGSDPSISSYHNSQSGVLGAGTYEFVFDAYNDNISDFATNSFLMNFNI